MTELVDNEEQVVSVFEDLVRMTVGPERYDQEVERKRVLRERYDNHEFFTYELYILCLLHQEGDMRTIELENEWTDMFNTSESPVVFESVYGQLCEGGLINNYTEHNGWDQIHTTSLTDKGEQMLKAFLSE